MGYSALSGISAWPCNTGTGNSVFWTWEDGCSHGLTEVLVAYIRTNQSTFSRAERASQALTLETGAINSRWLWEEGKSFFFKDVLFFIYMYGVCVLVCVYVCACVCVCLCVWVLAYGWQDLLYLASNSICSWNWPWTSYPLASIDKALGLQVDATPIQQLVLKSRCRVLQHKPCWLAGTVWAPVREGSLECMTVDHELWSLGRNGQYEHSNKILILAKKQF